MKYAAFSILFATLILATFALADMHVATSTEETHNEPIRSQSVAADQELTTHQQEIRNPQTGKEIRIAEKNTQTTAAQIKQTDGEVYFVDVTLIHAASTISSTDANCNLSDINEIKCEVQPFDGESRMDGGEGNSYCWGRNELRECPNEELLTQEEQARRYGESITIHNIQAQSFHRTNSPESAIETYYQGFTNQYVDLDEDRVELISVWSAREEDTSTETVRLGFGNINVQYSATNNNGRGGVMSIDAPEMTVPANTLLFTTAQFGDAVFRADGSLCATTNHFLREGRCDDGFSDKAAAAGDGVGEILKTHVCPIHGYRLIIARPAGYASTASERVLQAEIMNKHFHATWNEVSALINNYGPDQLSYFKLPQDLDFNAQRYCNRDGHMIPVDTDVYQVSLAHYNNYNGVTSIFSDNNIETAPLHLVVSAYNQRRNQGDALPPTCNYGCLSGSSGVMPDTKPADINFGNIDFGDTDPRDPTTNPGGVDVTPGVGGNSGVDTTYSDDKQITVVHKTTLAHGLSPHELSKEDKQELNEYLQNKTTLTGAQLGLAIAVSATENVRNIRYNNQTNTIIIKHDEEMKLLGIISVRGKATTTIHESGIEETKRPWWSFLATKQERVGFKAGADLSKSTQ